MKQFFVEVTVGIFLNEMDNENSPESIAELTDDLVNESISQYWNADIVTTVTAVTEIHPNYTSDDILGSYTTGGLDSLRANGLQL